MNDNEEGGGQTVLVPLMEAGKDIIFAPRTAVTIICEFPDGSEFEVQLHPGASLRLRPSVGNVPRISISNVSDEAGLHLV